MTLEDFLSINKYRVGAVAFASMSLALAMWLAEKGIAVAKIEFGRLHS